MGQQMFETHEQNKASTVISRRTHDLAERGRRRLKDLYDKIGARYFAAAAIAGFTFSLLLRWFDIDNAVVSLIISMTLLAVCLLVFKFGPWLNYEFARAIRAMWMPLAITVGAAVLLFYEGQGRDLGVGLLGERFLQIALLCPILIYWGINNWHSARLGLNYEFQPLTGKERWVFWLPRLLGVCAHLFAALSLAIAAWNIVTAGGSDPPALTLGNGVVFAAPVIIALVTGAMWALDVADPKRTRPVPFDRSRARRTFYIVLIGTVAIFVWLCCLEYSEMVPPGLSLATFSISLSAVAFLLFVSLSRRKFDPTPATHHGLTWLLAAPAILAVPIVCIFPAVFGGWLGSLNVCFFAFGGVLAVINWVGWFGRFIVDMDVRVERFKFAAKFLLFLLLLASLTSVMRPFHRVRLCDVEPCTAASSIGWQAIQRIGDRPGIREAALAWYRQADELYHEGGKNSGKPVPMLIIASAGGGIRAAYWTATVLEQLQTDLKQRGQSLDKYLFAISGVSGGSVGAMNYIAARHFGEKPTEYLQSDFLAPAIASLIFADGPSNFLPDFGQLDRGAALERSFEAGSRGHLANAFLSFFPNSADLKPHWRPALFLNATHQETGRRIITSNLKIEKDTFLDSFDALELLGSDMRASTAAHNSARFTYVSPAGKLLARIGDGQDMKTANRGYVIDGGYFENYGALTALELARSARDEIKRTNGSVKLVILQISSDPTLTKGRTRVRILEEENGCSLAMEIAPGTPKEKEVFLSFKDAQYNRETWRWENNDGEGLVVSYLNELAAPLLGVTAVREARGRLAAAELASAVCTERNTIKPVPSGPTEMQQPAAVADPMMGKTSVGTDKTSHFVAAAPLRPSEAPHFVHLAMCQVSDSNRAPIVPPLGWVLSKPMQKNFTAILKDCENEREVSRLRMALE